MLKATSELRRLARQARASGAMEAILASEEQVREYLFRTHCVARASVSLMQAAARAAKARSRSDPVAAGIVDYLARHIEEERDHARWLARDLAALGVPAHELEERLPPPSIAAGVGAQYYWVQHFHPVSLFGYMGVLESSAPSVTTLKKALRRSPVPATALRTVLWHAERDPEHAGDIWACLESLPLLPRHHVALKASAEATLRLLRANGEELLARRRALGPLLRRLEPMP
jgi:pyrroloquinoline quinone (PQQ) biosynthesis protein C